MPHTQRKIKQDLQQLAINQTQYALGSGALTSLPTSFDIYPDHGVNFIIRELKSLQKKEKTSKKTTNSQNNKPFNPFLPYEEDLYVGHLSNSHVCILNKFNVVDHHLLIVTADYQSQNDLLTLSDFEALHSCLTQINGLAFYNGGKTAGASQHHKHLQIVPLPLVPNWTCPYGFQLPIETRLYNTDQQPLFSYQIHFFENPSFNQLSVAQLFSIYQSLMAKIHRWPSDGSNQPLADYNLLCTQRWMMLIPRCKESIDGISINSLGFSGALLVKNSSELAYLLNNGPMNTLIQTTQ